MSSTTPNTTDQDTQQKVGWVWNKLGYENLPAPGEEGSFYNLKVDLPGNKTLDLAETKGKVVLIVNTASACGFTPQYTALQALHDKYKNQGLIVLGFPCDQFGGQEPGTDDEIASFCTLNHGVDFKLAKKSEVNGRTQNPVYTWLKAQENGKGLLGTTVIKWNFEKFLIGKDGKVISRWSSMTKPEKLSEEVEKALNA